MARRFGRDEYSGFQAPLTLLPARSEPLDSARFRSRILLDLFSARCSASLFDSNALRLFLSTFAMVLVNRLRDALAGAGTRLERAYPGTPHDRLLKVGARVRIIARRVHVALSSACPDRGAFALGWRSLSHT